MLKQAINEAAADARTVLTVKNLESYYGPIMASSSCRKAARCFRC